MEQDIELLITTTRAMRKFQKQWFMYKNRKDLAKSISLESQVDDILKRLPEPQQISFSQKGLFQDDETRF